MTNKATTKRPKRPATKAAKKTPQKARPLNVRQARFCELVASGKSQAESYVEAGWKVTKLDARKHAARLMTKDGIRDRIAELRRPQTRKTLMSRDRKREILARIAEDDGSGKLAIIRAIEVDAKLAGHFEPDRMEIEAGPNTLATAKERAQKVASLMSLAYLARQ
jgi:hypothetical protein